MSDLAGPSINDDLPKSLKIRSNSHTSEAGLPVNILEIQNVNQAPIPQGVGVGVYLIRCAPETGPFRTAAGHRAAGRRQTAEEIAQPREGQTQSGPPPSQIRPSQKRRAAQGDHDHRQEPRRGRRREPEDKGDDEDRPWHGRGRLTLSTPRPECQSGGIFAVQRPIVAAVLESLPGDGVANPPNAFLW
jgi:hypothetical protein